MPRPTTACERCGRTVTTEAGCPRHRGARLLDLRREEDRAWRDEVVAMRRHRLWRMTTAIAGTFGMVFALVALTRLMTSGNVSHIYGDVGITWFLSRVLQVLSGGLVVGGLMWGGLGGVRVFRERSQMADPIDKQAATRELARRAAAVGTSIVFAVSMVVLKDHLVGVPAELVAAAVALASAPVFLSILDLPNLLVGRTSTPSAVLPPVADHVPADSRAHDPLEQVRKNALRRSIMERR